jgi:K(+)-stimulated pyrophosphate-energized sodium pump
MVLETFYYISAAAVIGLLFSGFKAFQLSKQDSGSARMQEIASFIREGAMAYLKKQYSILLVFVIIVAALLYFIIDLNTTLAFVLGAVCSALAGYIGMNIATLANVRTTEAAKKSLKDALNISFSSGVVMAMFASSIGVLGIIFLYYLFQNPVDLNITLAQIFGFSFGASSVALFARVGGGIFTKAADVGADLAGKVEQHIPEDDPRNPAVIADNVGDNVGDVAGMGADLFESYVGAIISSMAIGLLAFGLMGLKLPLIVAGIGIIASLIATFFVRGGTGNIHNAFHFGMIFAAVIVSVASYYVIHTLMPAEAALGLFLTVVIGLLAGILIGVNTDRYTSENKKYAREIAESAKSGVAPVIIKGFVVGMRSTRNTLLIIALAILAAFYFGGMFGIALAAVAMLSTLGISLAVDAFGPVVDNAGGIAEMTNQPAGVRKITDKLDAAGNTTAAMGKGFAIGSAALTALALFSTYAIKADLTVINIVDPKILIGLFLGAMLPFYFSSMTMNSVGKAAFKMVDEVRRQFKEIKGLMQGKAQPDYKRCIAISTDTALKEMVGPGLLAIIAPLVVGIIAGPGALGGLLAGALVTGVCLANVLSNAGGAWDNAKKLIESKKKDTKEWHDIHDATVIADTVGDPFKDTSGPSLNILLKLMSIVSLIFIPLFLNPLI